MTQAHDVGPAAIGHRQPLSKLVLSFAAVSLALAGAALAFGIMAARALREGFDYSALSWALIAPVWGLLAVSALLVQRWRIAALPLGWLSIFAGVYYADVYGLYPAVGLFLLSALVVFAPEQEKRAARAGFRPDTRIWTP